MSSVKALDELVNGWETAYLRGEDLPAEELCGGRLELLESLRALIAVRRAKVEALRQNSTTVIEPPARPSVHGFEILERLGVGAVGEVWKAWQPALKRHVAIKFMRREALADQQAVQRFRQEAKAVAQLQRAEIVQIYDVCIPEDGRPPYLVLEYVAGGTLAQKLTGEPWAPKEAAAFIEEIARAMHVVHRRGIVHRDLKPANILLQKSEDRKQRTEDKGQKTEDREQKEAESSPGSSVLCPLSSVLFPKITDFGLAKRYERLPGASTTFERTQTGLILGTPNYMAPEQARGETSKIGPPADVHALGAILYEMLTGRPPFRAANHLDTLLLVIHTEPVPVRELQPPVPRDLESICLKCLRKEPELRYTSAGALAEDLRRFQVGEPVQANPVSSLEKVFRWGRRHLIAVSLATAALLLLLINLIAAHLSARAARAEAEHFQELAAAAENQRQLAAREKAEADQRAAVLQAQLGAVQLARVALLADSDPARALAVLRDAAIFPPDKRDAAWHFYDHLATCNTAIPWRAAWLDAGNAARQTLLGHQDAVLALALSADGKTLASGGADRVIRLWDLTDFREIAALPPQKRPVVALAFCGHARVLASCAGEGVVGRWQGLAGTPLESLGEDRKGAVAVVVAARGSLLAVGYDDAAVALWDASSETLLRTLAAHGQAVTALAWSPDGKTLASAGADRKLKLWNVENGEPQGNALDLGQAPGAIAWSPDGKVVAVADGATIQLWHTGDRKVIGVLRGHSGDVRALAFSADGKIVASAGADGTIKLWEVGTGVERATIPAHGGGATAVLFGGDGRLLVSAGADGTIKLWIVGGR
jgi:serine/threonine protein kinase